MSLAYESFAQTVNERSTCRQFLPDPVPQATIERILDISQRTPSWSNTQPWQLVITRGEGTERLRKSLLDQVFSGAADAPDFDFPHRYDGEFRQRRRDCAVQLYESVGITRDDRDGSARQGMRNFEFFDAPHVAILTTEADLGAYGAIDCGLYINTFVLAATSLGVATATQAAPATYSSFLRDYFDLPENRLVVAGICFGYADSSDPVNGFRTPRAASADVVTWID